MRGDLSETPAADACRILAGDGVTGVLRIESPGGSGSVAFLAGRIVGATSPVPRARLGDRLVGAGFLADETLDEALETQRATVGGIRLGALLVERTQVRRDAIRLFVQEQTLDAMFEVLRWRSGSYSFEQADVSDVPEVPVAMTVDQALVEVARRQQQWRDVSQIIPDLEAVPNFRFDAGSAAASLEPDELAVLASIDGYRSVRTLAADLGYGEFELARIVYGLALIGVVEIQLPDDEVGASPDAPAYPDDPGPRAENEPPERSYSDVFRELRGLVGDTPSSADVPPSEPPPGPRADAGDAAPSRPQPRPVDDADVSEFLRELSRLAIDETPPESVRPRRPPPPNQPRGDGGKARRRGLFGRG